MQAKICWLWLAALMLSPARGLAQGTPDIRTRSVEALIADLRVDDIPGNLTRAMWELPRRPGEEAKPLLEAALWSDDWQQRLCAARLLCEHRHLWPVPIRAHEVLIENLGTDDRRGNATAALNAMRDRWLPRQAMVWLRQDLYSPDPQRRFHAAVILTHHWREPFTRRMCEVLVENLGEDSIRNNAAEARWALHRRSLYRVPAESLLPLQEALGSDQAQMRLAAAQALMRAGELPVTPELLELLLEDFPACDDEFTTRMVMAAFSNVHGEVEPQTILALRRAMDSDCQRLRLTAARIVATEGPRMDREMQGQMVGVLIDNLRQDDREENATIARRILRGMVPPPNFLLDALDRTLLSQDHQQSQMAAMILTGFCRDGLIEPDSRLCRVLVEAFHTEERHWDSESGRWIDGPWPRVRRNQVNALRFFLNHFPDAGTEALEAALDSSDPNQQLMAASILARTGRTDRLEDIAEILLVNLVADRQRGNASQACAALSRMGPTVVPILEMFIDYEHDDQLSHGAQLALANVLSGGADRYGRTRFGTTITRLSRAHDPEMIALVRAPPCSQ